MGPNLDQSSATSRRHPDDKTTVNREPVRFPRVGEGVQIDARDGVFVVMRTDISGGTVDVLGMSGVRQIEGGVPVESVRILHRPSPMDHPQTSKK